MTGKVIDTNVLIQASIKDPSDPRAQQDHPIADEDREVVLNWLDHFMNSEDLLFLDTADKIRHEYHHKLTEQEYAYFLVDYKWHKAQVELYSVNYDQDGHAILENYLQEIVNDASDRKFVAVLAQAKEEYEATLVNATDTDWLDWQEALSGYGLRIEFLLEEWCRTVWQGKKNRNL